MATVQEQCRQEQTEIKALESFVLDNRDLRELEARIAQFNIFEAIGVVRQELRHSDFLAFLLNPSANHGLNDAFLKRFLIQLMRSAVDPPVRALELDLIKFSSASVVREWNAVDILIHDPQNSICCFIENKVGTTEHDDQLRRYYSSVRQSYPNQILIPVYLTPDANPPSDERYIPVGYSDIAACVEEVMVNAAPAARDAKILLGHYIEMLRRHIVTNSDIADLCRRIYRQHQRALDLIFEHRPDLQQDIYELLQDTIRQNDRVSLDSSSKGYIRFFPKSWDEVADLKLGEGWTPSGRILLFEFANQENLILRLIIGPGRQEIRERLFEVARQRQKGNMRPGGKLYKKWNTIWRKGFLTREDYDGGELEEIGPLFRERWEEFLLKDLPKLEPLFSKAPTDG